MSKKTWTARFFLSVAKNARFGTLDLTTPDGKTTQLGEGEPHIEASVHDWEVFDDITSRGDIGLAEAIISERLVVDDAAALIEWACRNDQAMHKNIYGSFRGVILDRLRHFLNRNTKQQASENIRSHYDLGNEFYKLWLDPSMTYSSAIFENPSLSLQQAQHGKYDRILRELNVGSGDHVLEIGCGWGGFFSRAIEKTDCKVTAITLSPAQRDYALDRAKQLGMSKQVDVRLEDYRDIRDKYSRVVSIEMIEAVGAQYWDTYFSTIRQSLASKGQALIQGITIRDDLFFKYKRGTDFIQKYIFPGGMLPSEKVIEEKSREHDLTLTSSFTFGLDYATTLEKWQTSFRKARSQVETLGFDDAFIRMWDFYYSFCIGAFRAGRINVGQYRLAAH